MRSFVTRILIVGGLVGLLLAGAGQTVGADKPEGPQLSTLEGELKVHPKYLYRYYLVFGDQKCALYGLELRQDVEQLARLQAGARIRVRGVLGTMYHAGGTKENPSPFPPAWVLYMEVREVEHLK
jgi:hypothetical protein